MSVFPEFMKRLNKKDSEGSLKTIEDYITYMQERIDFSISHLRADYIVAGEITAERLNLTGSVNWGDLDGEVQSRISAAGGVLTIEVGNETDRSTITLKKDGIAISSGTVNMSGMVTFTDLSTSGQTTINGANITTGTISAERLNLTGEITWSDLASSTQTTIGTTATSAATSYCSTQGFLNGNTGVQKTTRIGQSSIITESLEANNLAITGGSIRIETSSQYFDAIKLSYGSFISYMTPQRFNVTNGTYTSYLDPDGLSAPSVVVKGTTPGSITTLGGITVTGAVTVGDGIVASNSSQSIGSTSTYFNMVHTNNVDIHTSTTTSNSSVGYKTADTGGGFYVQKYSGSSLRHKHDIDDLDNTWKDKIHSLYDIQVKKWKYNDDYIDNSDELFDTETIGIIAEDLEDIMPTAVIHENGQVDNYRERDLLNAMLYLLQEQHKEIEDLKEKANGQ